MSSYSAQGPPDSHAVLHVHATLDHSGTLVLSPETDDQCTVPLTGAQTSFLLTLFVARVLDLRAGVVGKIGRRKPDQIGKLYGQMPGAAGWVKGSAIGAYKRDVMRRIRREVEKTSRQLERNTASPEIIVHPAWGEGYCLWEEGLRVEGIDMAPLVERLWNSPEFKPANRLREY